VSFQGSGAVAPRGARRFRTHGPRADSAGSGPVEKTPMRHAKWWIGGVAALVLAGWTYTVAQDAGREGRTRGKRAGAGEKGERRRPGAATARRGGGGGEMAFDYAGVAAEMNLAGAQAQKLTGLILNQFMLARTRRAELSDDQKAQLKAACMGAATDLLAATDARGKMTATRAVQQTLRNEILTDEQKKKMGRGAPGGRDRPAGKRGGAGGGERRKKRGAGETAP